MSRLKTTVYLDREDYQRLKAIALREGSSPAGLIREAIAEYAARHEPELPRSIGAGASGKADWADRAEERLDGFGES